METYEEFINNILNTRGRFNCSGYYEQHHIIPKCIGGTNDESNLIDLYAKEHFIAHKLLAVENPDDDKLIYGWIMMAFVKDKNQQRYELTPEEYESARLALSKIASKKYNGDCNPFYGKHHSEETRERMRESSRKRWDKPEEREKARKAKENITQETRNKMSEAAIKRMSNPENNPSYGKSPSEETRRKMSDAAKLRCTEEWKQKMRTNDNCKHIICIETNQWYISIREANRQTGISRYQISMSVRSNGVKAAGKDENGEYLHWISANNLISDDVSLST